MSLHLKGASSQIKEVSMGTIIVGSIVLGVVAFIIRGMVKAKKNGKSIQCGCDCKHCGGHCLEQSND